MQGTAAVDHHIADTRLPQADPGFDATTAVDTAGGRLDPQPAVVQHLVHCSPRTLCTSASGHPDGVTRWPLRRFLVTDQG